MTSKLCLNLHIANDESLYINSPIFSTKKHFTVKIKSRGLKSIITSESATMKFITITCIMHVVQ